MVTAPITDIHWSPSAEREIHLPINYLAMKDHHGCMVDRQLYNIIHAVSSLPCLPRMVLIQYKTISSSGKFPVSKISDFFLEFWEGPSIPRFLIFLWELWGTKNIASYLNMNRLTIWNKKGPVTICSTLRQERNCNNIFALLWLSPCKPEQIIHREIYENMYIYIYVCLIITFYMISWSPFITVNKEMYTIDIARDFKCKTSVTY